MEKSISFNSCNRLRQIQSLLTINNLDALLCVLGIDGNYNKGCLQLANYLLFNLFNENQPAYRNIPEEHFDDVILLIKPDTVHIYCNPFNRTILLPYISHWHNLCFHCLTPDKFEDEQTAEDFKIRSFIAMVTDCQKIGVPYSDKVEPFSKFYVEKWPIVQAFANEDYNSGGFFTLKYEVLDISKELLPLYEIVDPAYLEILVTKHLSSIGNHWNTMMALTSLGLSTDNLQMKESKISEPLKSYYNHGKPKNSPQDGSYSPFVLFGNNATKKFIQNLSTVKASNLESTGTNGEPAILMVCQEVSPCFPVTCLRTYFFNNETYKYNEKPQEVDAKYSREIETLYLALIDAVLQSIDVYKETENLKKAEEKAKEILQECKAILKNESLKKHLERRDNIFFVLETVSISKSNTNKFSPGSVMKKIQMYIWDIPCKERKSGSTYGSLGFGETFVISSIQTENSEESRNNETLVITSHIPRYHCWRTIPLDNNIETVCESLMLTDVFGKVLFNANAVDIFTLNKQCDFSSTGDLYVLENGIIILRPMQDPICIPNSRTISMETYYKDSFSSLAIILIEITADQTKILPANLSNSDGNLIVVFKQGTKARKIFFSQLLPFWRKAGQITHVDEVEPEVQEMYNHLMKHETDTSGQSSMPGFKCEWTLKQAAFHLPRLTEFFNHLLVSTTFQTPLQSELIPILLKKWPKSSTISEEVDDKVIITIISGIRGSHKEKVFKVLSSLSKEHNRWMILNNSIEETNSFDGDKLQKYLSSSITSHQKNISGTGADYDKILRVIIVVPGYTETVDVIRAIMNHPNSQVRNKIKIGAVTVCINPDNCFLENRFIYPVLLNQCATGWLNNILFITNRNNESLVSEIQLLIRSANPQVSFLMAHKGKFQSHDFDLILSETAFDNPSLCRARNLLYPNWQKSPLTKDSPIPFEDVMLEFFQPLQKHCLKLKLAGLKGNLSGFSFHKNIYNVRGQVLFSGDKQMYTFHYITLSNQLDIEAATLTPSPPKSTHEKEKKKPKYFVIFSGCHLDKETLQNWLRPCFKNIPEKKSLLNRRDLPAHIIKKVQDEHRLDSLPAGWYYNGQQYVCLTGERAIQHPYLEEFLDKYTERTNMEVNDFNAEIEKERKLFYFL